MKIQRIDNTAFGYNKKTNKQLIKKLDAQQDQNNYVTQTIRELNTLCNNTEDKVRAAYKDNDESGDLILNALTTSKIGLAYMLEEEYPELEFTKNEIKSYASELDQIEITPDEDLYIPWQVTMVLELQELLNSLEENINPSSDPNNDKEINEDNTTQISNNSNVTQEKSEITLPKEINILEQFAPTEFSPTGFDSLGGLDNLKADLYDKIIYPAKHPEEAALDFAEYGKRLPRGYMLSGPPGCGKTSIVEALSAESGFPLFKLKISKAGSKYINETSNNYQKAFDYVAKYSQAYQVPCLFFIDEIDGMTKNRDGENSSEDLKQMGTLLNLIETASSKNIIVLGATNKYNIIDDAIKRRFDEQIYIGMPDTKTREAILHKTLSKWLKGIPLAEDRASLNEVAEKMENYPSSAIVIISEKASNLARKDGRRPISKEDFFTVLQDSQNLKIEEDNYSLSSNRKKIGFPSMHNTNKKV